MMYETGVAYSLKEVGEKFIVFAQRSNSNTQGWELLDSRLSSFYGATLKIPMKDWEDVEGNVPCFYLSMQHMDIFGKQGESNSTYANWIRTGIRLNEYVAKDHENEYMEDHTDIYYQSEKYNHSLFIYDGRRYVDTKYGARNRENVFKNTGELIAVGLHTLYDENLWMCEQGQITCKKESTEQINDLNLLPTLTSTIEGNATDPGQSLEDLPVFPCTGCPWFTISDDNKEEFDVASNGIKYWFTKNDYDATITIMVHNYGAIPDTYQSMSFGRLGVLDKKHYMFPLYVAGGTEGLSQDTMIYTPPKASKSANMGARNVYDLDIRNICLSNSNLLSPTKFNDANMSNFRVLSPEGTWKDIYAYEQKCNLQPVWSCAVCNGEDPSDFVVLLEKPEDLEEEHHSAYHCMADSWHRMDIYTVNRVFNGYDHSSTLERVLVFFNSLIETGENGYQGLIPNVYANWFRELPAGEVTISNKKYLSVPNGWETRLWHYETGVSPPTRNDLDNSNIAKKIDDLLKKGNNNIMSHRLLIPLEDGA